VAQRCNATHVEKGTAPYLGLFLNSNNFGSQFRKLQTAATSISKTYGDLNSESNGADLPKAMAPTSIPKVRKMAAISISKIQMTATSIPKTTDGSHLNYENYGRRRPRFRKHTVISIPKIQMEATSILKTTDGSDLNSEDTDDSGLNFENTDGGDLNSKNYG
jgi:hypothetical protein